MKYLTVLVLAAVTAVAMTAIMAASALAATLEVDGVTQNKEVTLTASIDTGAPGGGSTVLSRTDGSLANTCTESHLHATTAAPYSATVIGGNVTELSFTNCTINPVVVHKMGTLSFERIGATNNGTIRSAGAEWTIPTSLGFTINCKTNEGVDLGTLTGTTSGNATIHVNAVLNCGFLLPSASWKGTYQITKVNGSAGTGLGVSG